ncbi:unnamed protein product [Bursaphelenchus xylophilus]|uniref:(pine wood nematode) hypothetical protein n=1 Tax=Bursaphelenchus xylophilus TaxID=6326 RepID=A0A1I7RMN6_BURXY|nr:unnamed protein product [Bursaphelenchus xylophilus]CAG9125638.1 unnamed protein product [Bursaphelenchus xylophilus]
MRTLCVLLSIGVGVLAKITEETFGTVHDGKLMFTNYEPVQFARQPQSGGQRIRNFPAYLDDDGYSYFGQAYQREDLAFCAVFNVRQKIVKTCDRFRILVNIPGNEYNLRRYENLKESDEKMTIGDATLVLAKDIEREGDTVFGTLFQRNSGPPVVQYIDYNFDAKELVLEGGESSKYVLFVVKSKLESE